MDVERQSRSVITCGYIAPRYRYAFWNGYRQERGDGSRTLCGARATYRFVDLAWVSAAYIAAGLALIFAAIQMWRAG